MATDDAHLIQQAKEENEQGNAADTEAQKIATVAKRDVNAKRKQSLRHYRDSGKALSKIEKMQRGQWVQWCRRNGKTLGMSYETVLHNIMIYEEWTEVVKDLLTQTTVPRKAAVIKAIKAERDARDGRPADKVDKRKLTPKQKEAIKRRKKKEKAYRDTLKLAFNQYIRNLTLDELEVFSYELGKGFYGPGWQELHDGIQHTVCCKYEYDYRDEFDWMPGARRKEMKTAYIRRRTVIALNRKRATKEQLSKMEVELQRLKERLEPPTDSPPIIFYSGDLAQYNPEEVLEGEVNLMPSFKDIYKNGTAKKRFMRIVEARKAAAEKCKE